MDNHLGVGEGGDHLRLDGVGYAVCLAQGDAAIELEVELDELQHWDRAPSNPARLAEAGVPFALTTEKLEKPEKDFWSRLRLAVLEQLLQE